MCHYCTLPADQMIRGIDETWVKDVASSIENNNNAAVAPMLAMTQHPVKQNSMSNVSS